MKTITCYKLFEMDTQNNLYPLFIDKHTSYPIGEWIYAENHPTKGFAARPGLHCGMICSAPWLMSADGTYKSQRSKYWKRVWCEVECNVTVDYTEEVQKLPKRCFVNQVPKNGFYHFRETGCNRVWIITDRIKINRVISEEERMDILNGMNYDEQQAFAPYKAAMEKRMKIA